MEHNELYSKMSPIAIEFQHFLVLLYGYYLDIFKNNLIWYVSLFLIGGKIASISVWMKK